MFSEEAPNLSKNLITMSVRDGLYFPSDILGGLRSCCWVAVFFLSCLVAVLWVSRTLVPCAKGAPKLSDVLLRNCEEISWEVFSLTCGFVFM